MGVFYRDISCLWTMGSAVLMHLLTTFPICLLFIVAVTKGDGIEMFVEYPLYFPMLFVVTYGITLMILVFGRAKKYAIGAEGVSLNIPLLVCCPNRELYMQAGPITNVGQWDDFSRLWYGQP